MLSGVKHLITGAPFVEGAQVVARVEGAGRRELSAFLVPMDAPGVVRGPVQQTIMADGQTGVLEFHEVRVDRAALIAREGAGLDMAFLWINWARSRRGGMCSGLAAHCLDRAVAYGRERRAFGRPIGEMGAVAERLSDIYLDWRAMRALSLEILARLDAADVLGDGRAGPAERRDLSTLKTWCDEALMRVADRAIQVHGGRGLLSATGIERIFRVARNLRIPAGHDRDPAGDDRREPRGSRGRRPLGAGRLVEGERLDRRGHAGRAGHRRGPRPEVERAVGGVQQQRHDVAAADPAQDAGAAVELAEARDPVGADARAR